MPVDIIEELPDYRAGQAGFGLKEVVGSRMIQSDAPAGVYVFPSDDQECDLPAAASDITDGLGGFLKNVADRIPNDNGLEWAAGDYVRYVREGYVVVITEVAVSDQDPVYVRHAPDGGNTQLGACSNAAGVGLALLPNARFEKDAASGLALVRRGS